MVVGEFGFFMISIALLIAAGFFWSKLEISEQRSKAPSSSASQESLFSPSTQAIGGTHPNQYVPVSPIRNIESEKCEALRQRLRLICLYDEKKIDRLVAFERSRTPGSPLSILMQDAIKRWERDNRV